MKSIKIETDVLDMVIAALGQSELFGYLEPDMLGKIVNIAELNEYEPDEVIVQMDEPSDAFFMIVKGTVAILHYYSQPDGDIVELGRKTPYSVIGEIGLLLNQPRTATVQAVEETLMLKFNEPVFDYMLKIPAFGRAISYSLAARVQQISGQIPLPIYEKEAERPSPNVIQLLPMDFIIRHHILPLQIEANFLRVGFLHEPKVSDLRALQRFLPSMQLKLVHIDKELFDEVLQSQAGVGEWSAPPEKPPEPEKALEYKAAPRLDPLLKRMVAEGASDLHLSAKRPPRWRIDGELHLIQDVKEIGSEEVLEILNPVLDKHEQLEFKASWNTDFSYTLPGVARFRGNIFRDEKGIGTVLRMIPDKILSLEQLGLPLVIKKLCEKPKGLVLVTGPAGSGKSTTLAAMIDDINTTRYAHIITMEDPIEFVHKEECALINQRQIGLHTPNYATAIRAALREDPDIILIGELRDRETIALALEAANTGSLVFGTLHTATAINTVARIIDFFPSDQHKHIRSSLCDSLEGIISQTLCKRIGGGRVAAVEVLIVNTAVNNLIREEKTNQIASIMQSTGKTQGHRLLNEELTRLVKRKKVRYEEALSKTPEPEDLARRLGKRLPKD